MRHFAGKIPEHFDANNDVFPIEEKALTDNLIAYLPFEGDSNAAVGDLSGRVSLVPHDYVTDGKIGKALSLSGSNPVCFGKPAALKFGKERDFTFAFWFRTDKIQKGSAAILGNKNWNDCFQAGIVVTANVGSDEGNKLAFNLGDAVNHHDINPLEYAPDGQWHFAAITADRDGDAILYLGLPDGNLAFIAERLGNFGDIDNMNWYPGSRRHGNQPAAFVGDIDELMVWDRVLSMRRFTALSSRAGRKQRSEIVPVPRMKNRKVSKPLKNFPLFPDFEGEERNLGPGVMYTCRGKSPLIFLTAMIH